MGIKSLSKFLKTKFPNLFKPIYLAEFREKKVAVDIASYLYKYKATAQGGRWLDNITRFFLKLRKINIHPIFIFDSGARPEKSEELALRRATQEKTKARTDQLEFDLNVTHEEGIISEELYEYCKKRGIAQKKTITTTGKIVELDLTTLKAELDRRRKQEIRITQEDIQKVKNILNVLGIPFMQASHEAEAFCTKLCINNLVDAVISEDTDCLAYACPVFLYSVDLQNFCCFRLDYNEILISLNLTSSEFLDFCIMCGTDYNDNIPKIGPAKALPLIQKYKNIDTLKDNGFQTEVLKYARTRELFRFTDTPIPYKIEFCDIPALDKVKTVFLENYINIGIYEVQRSCFQKIFVEGEEEVESEEVYEDNFTQIKSFFDRSRKII